MIYEGKARRCVAMPLGGLGTGSLAIRGDGSLGQWQLSNRINHVAYVPFSFFAFFWDQDARRGAKLLQSDEFWDEPDFAPPPTTTDHVVPEALKAWSRDLPKAGIVRFDGRYPEAALEYDLGEGCPFSLRLKAWSPLVPGDPEDSGWPAAVFEFEVRNETCRSAHAHLLSSIQNFVGWDGITLVDGVSNPGFGGNLNRFEPGRLGPGEVVPGEESAALWLENVELPEDDPAAGTLALAARGGRISGLAQWAKIEEIWPAFRDRGRLPGAVSLGPSEKGSTWNGAILQAKELQGGESFRFTVVLAWQFPNRYVDFAQWESLVPNDKSRFYLGNRYTKRGSLRRWLPELLDRLPELRRRTEAYVETVFGQALPAPVIDAAYSNVANLRTNICLWTEDGRFYGFEGGHGASTWEGASGAGGCCPMNCAHVWNYDQTLVGLWPALFRSMRETDWDHNLHASGYLPHRTPLPLYLPRLWDVAIGGPEKPAIDGLFAAMLKTYQYWQATADRPWLDARWQSIKQALRYVFSQDEAGEGMLRGEQPNTYDISLFGPNTFVGSQYLAALRAVEEMAADLGEPAVAAECRRRFELGSAGYDRECFNGEFYVQRVPEGCDAPFQFGPGCVADQLLGEWWARHLGLGGVLPEEHVRTALAAIVRRNFRESFEGFVQTPRVFASDHDQGLLNGTYLPGERPEVPLLYSDEVWPGVEYAFAALCVHHGLVDEGLKVASAVRARYDGQERNPFNEVECGDHYIRSLSAASMPAAFHGVGYSAPRRRLTLPRRPVSTLRAVVTCGGASLSVVYGKDDGSLTVLTGELPLESLEGPADLRLNGQPWPGETILREGYVVRFAI